nr:hypothetical protein [Chitinophagales bacterium]
MNLSYLIKRNTKRTVFAFLLCCVCIFVNAQTVWNKTYIEDRPSMQYTSIVEADSGYNLIGVTVNKTSPYYEQALTLVTDKNGFVIRYKANPDTININTGLFWNTLIKNDKNEFAFTGYGRDTVQHLVFGFLNNSFDSIKIFRYYTDSTFAFQGLSLIQYDNNTYYVAGGHNSKLGQNSNAVLIKIDSNGNRCWQKYYDRAKADFAESITKLSNGNLLIGAHSSDLNQTNERSNTWLIEVDTGGTVVRQWLDTNDSTYVAEG